MSYLRKFGLTVLLWFTVTSAFAAMVPTPHFESGAVTAQPARDLDQRTQLRLQLIQAGVDPIEAAQRVDRLTDRQISAVQGKITELPAGAGISTTNLLLIIIVLILLL